MVYGVLKQFRVNVYKIAHHTFEMYTTLPCEIEKATFRQ